MIHDAVLGRIRLPLEECISLQPDQINILDDLGLAPLHLAVLTGNMDAIHTLVELGADIDCPSRYNSETPLHLACQEVFDNIDKVFQESFVQVALALINHGASCHVQDSRGNTPLHLSYKHPIVTRSLLSLGADPNTRSKAGDAPFQRIINHPKESDRSQREVLKAYSEAGADFDAYYNGMTVLHEAAGSNPSLIPLLSVLGANINAVTQDEGWSLLHVLLFAGNLGGIVDQVPVSVLTGLNPDMADKYDWTLVEYLEMQVIAERRFLTGRRPRPREAWNFVKLIVELRELNWESGLFLDYKKHLMQDGSHSQMKRWVSLQTERIGQYEEGEGIGWSSLDRRMWRGLDDYWDNESQTEEEHDIGVSLGHFERKGDGTGLPQYDGKGVEDSEDEDDVFFDAVQSWDTTLPCGL